MINIDAQAISASPSAVHGGRNCSIRCGNNRLTVYPCASNINPLVFPPVSPLRGKLCKSRNRPFQFTRGGIIPKNVRHILWIAISGNTKLLLLQFGKLCGVFLRISAVIFKRPVYVPAAEIVSLQGKRQLLCIFRRGAAGPTETACQILYSDLYGIFRIRNAIRILFIVRTLAALHGIAAASTAFLHHNGADNRLKRRDPILLRVLMDKCSILSDIFADRLASCGRIPLQGCVHKLRPHPLLIRETQIFHKLFWSIVRNNDCNFCMSRGAALQNKIIFQRNDYPAAGRTFRLFYLIGKGLPQESLIIILGHMRKIIFVQDAINRRRPYGIHSGIFISQMDFICVFVILDFFF